MSITDSSRGLPDQPGPTCPYIDKAIDSANEVLDHFDLIGQPGVEFDSVRDDIESSVSDVGSSAEEARQNVMEIREWGQEWKDYALGLESEKEDLEEEKEQLERERDNLEEQIEEFKLSITREEQEDI